MNIALAQPLDILGRPYLAFRGSRPDDDAAGGDTSGTGTGTEDEGGGADSRNADDQAGGDEGPDRDGLTAGGRKLIQQERDAAKEAKRALSPWRKLERDFQKSPDEIRAILEAQESGNTDEARIRREAEAAANAKVTAKLVRSEVKGLAKGLFADPEDAFLFIDLDAIDVDDDGEVDTKAVERELKSILSRKPHLAAKREDDDTTDFDAGARRTAPKAKTMTDFIREQALAKQGRRA